MFLFQDFLETGIKHQCWDAMYELHLFKVGGSAAGQNSANQPNWSSFLKAVVWRRSGESWLRGKDSERQGWRGWNQRRWSTAMKDLTETKEILNLGNGWHVINSLTCVDICNLFSTSVDGLWLLSSGFNKECLYLKQLEVMEWFHSASIYGVVQVVLCSFCFLCCSHS